MTQATKTSSNASPDWQLVARTFRIFQNYQCHDHEPGLSTKDVQYLKESNFGLFKRVIQGFNPKTKDPDKVSPVEFLRVLDEIGKRKLLPQLERVAKNHLPPITKSIKLGGLQGDRFYLGRYFITSDTPIKKAALERFQDGIKNLLIRNGISLGVIQFSVHHPGHPPGKENEARARFTADINFYGGLCQKNKTKVPNS